MKNYYNNPEQPNHEQTSQLEHLEHPPSCEGVFSYQTIEGEVPIAGTNSKFILEIPDDPISDEVNVLVYGFAGSEPAYRGLAKAMASNHGLISLRCDLSRSQSIAAALHPQHLLHASAITSKQIRGAIGELPKYDLNDRVNLFTHSMGGWIGTEFALHKPEYVNQLTLFASAGLTDHSPRSLALGVPQIMGHAMLDLCRRNEFKPSLNDGLNCLKHIIKNPLLSAREAYEVAHCDIRSKINELVLKDIKLAFIQPTDDEFFDADKVLTETNGSMDNFRVIEANHLAPIMRPTMVASEYAKLLQDMSPKTTKKVAA